MGRENISCPPRCRTDHYISVPIPKIDSLSLGVILAPLALHHARQGGGGAPRYLKTAAQNQCVRYDRNCMLTSSWLNFLLFLF